MATKTSLLITATDYVTERDQQKTITDINPQASSAHLKSWARETIDMTKDTYLKAKRVDVTDIDSIVQRPIQRLRYFPDGNTSVTMSEQTVPNMPEDGQLTSTVTNGLSFACAIKTPYDIAPIVEVETTNNINVTLFSATYYGVNRGTAPEYWVIQCSAQGSPTVPVGTVCTVKVSFPPTNLYDAWSKTFTVNITEE